MKVSKIEILVFIVCVGFLMVFMGNIYVSSMTGISREDEIRRCEALISHERKKIHEDIMEELDMEDTEIESENKDNPIKDIEGKKKKKDEYIDQIKRDLSKEAKGRTNIYDVYFSKNDIEDQETEYDSSTEPKWNWNTLYPTYMLCPHIIMRYYNNRNDFLSSVIKSRFPDGIGAEVGVHQGSFSSHILGLTSLSKVYLIDAWESVDVYTGNYRSKDIQTTLKNVNRFEPERYELVKGYSFDVVHQFEDNYFDFVYIDGTHTYTAAKLDMMMWWPKVKPGGFLTGHDINLRVQELRNPQRGRDDPLGTHQYRMEEEGNEKEVYVLNVYDAAFEFAYHNGMRAVRMGESWYIYKCKEEDILKAQEILETSNPRPYEQLDDNHDYDGLW